MNSFKQALESKPSLLGTFIQIPAAESPEIIGRAGFDFGIVDTEHGMFGVDESIRMIRGCDAANLPCVYRVPRLDHQRIGQALDFGASAVMVPNLTSPEEAERVVNAAKYHPQGNRGICLFTRCAGFNSGDEDTDYFNRSNREIAIILQIEGVEGISRLEEILEVPNYDAIFIGPFDLSQSLGIPGKVTDPRVIQATADIVKKAAAKDVIVGNFAVTPEQVRISREIGVRFVAYGVDTLILHRAYRDLGRALGVKASTELVAN